MFGQEEFLWGKINNKKTKPQDASWLYNVYSPELSQHLGNLISEKLDLLYTEGWPELKSLLDKYGLQSDLIHAAGISHQSEAKECLMNNLIINDKLDLMLLKALTCWGAVLLHNLLRRILKDPRLEIRLAGLESLNFTLHVLTDPELLIMTKDRLRGYLK